MKRRHFIGTVAALGGGVAAFSCRDRQDAERLAAGASVDPDALDWDKAPCRFCGTGCSVMVATKDGQVVATHGDVQAEVNRGLNCVKGYFLSKIMYGEDRLTTPLLRMRDGERGKVPTEAFFSAAERYNMMPQIDRWVVSNTIRGVESE